MIPPPASIRELLRRAGWSSDRQVPVSARVPCEHPAQAVLASLGGLRVGSVGPGQECGAGDIAFRDADSELGVEDEWASCLSTRLICIGGEHNEHGELFIDSKGRVFGASVIHEVFYLHGLSFWPAIENVLLGRRAKPLIHPTQEHVTLYGERYDHGDPRLFSY
ncbi:MAG: SUKH-3 domain-containing protein [Xanthomonadales bacterium]|nr:SUKH-3 domain-containing protein [Planctomycetales bacterium]MCB1607342.1 SUKH-3 domain-containing protein [Xanthomonadales bacterium]